MLIGGMVDGNVEDHADASFAGFFEKACKHGRFLLHRGIGREPQQVGADAPVVADVETRITPRGVEDGQQPQTVHAQLAEVSELLFQPPEILVEKIRVKGIYNGILVPAFLVGRKADLPGGFLQLPDEFLQPAGVTARVKACPDALHPAHGIVFHKFLFK